MKKCLKSLICVIGASLLSMIIYMFLAIFLMAGAEDTESVGIQFIMALFCAVVYCGVLLWLRHMNDASENEFLREYRDTPYPGIKADIRRIVPFDVFTYLYVYLITGLTMAILLSGRPIDAFLIFYPMVGMMVIFHPIVGFVIHFVIFTVLYTLFFALLRMRWGTDSGGGGTGSVSRLTITAQRAARLNRRRWK